MANQRIPGLDDRGVERVLSEAVGRSVHLTNAIALGASSRETPWRIDVELDGAPMTYLLRYGSGCSRNEVLALRAMAEHPIPTPRIICWDEVGDALGVPLFVSAWIEGDPLLPAMKAKEDWAIDLYIDTACALQAIRSDDLPEGAVAQLNVGESARDVVEAAYARFAVRDDLIERSHRRLIERQPGLPEIAFSNGDLWPENLLVRNRELVGVIDWQHAGFTDPLFEFLLPFFLVPELRGLGIEERFCARKGIDPAVLPWYHGVEFFDSLAWVLKIGKPYEIHTEESLRTDLEAWLSAS